MTSPDSKLPNRKVSIWVKLFVLIHILAVAIWALPDPPSAVRNGQISPAGTQWLLYWNNKTLKPIPLLSDYVCVTGFWQYWDMFAPDPAQTDIYDDAEVVYKDGTVKHYQYPRMFLLPIPQKFLKERYRKFLERVNADDDTFLWPTFTMRIALLNDNLKNPPVTVRLFRHWRAVAPPGQPQATKYDSYMMYQHAVDQKELQQMRERPL